MVKFSVEDTGIGISAEKLPELFGQFNQAESSTTRFYGGTGLGLSIAKELVQMMGGTIDVQSKLGEGSTFTATVEFAQDYEVRPEPAFPNRELLAGTRILSVDDNAIARRIIEDMLFPFGVKVVSVGTGQEALDVLANHPSRFDAVITDYLMPGMTGEAMGVKIRVNTALRALPILFVTSSPQLGDGKRLEEAGFSGYLSKPLSQEKLTKCLALMIAEIKSGEKSPFFTQHHLKRIDATARFSYTHTLMFGNVNVLLVEDNAMSQLMAKTMLEKTGCHVTSASNGEEAVALFEQQKFDLILMDCQMPVMDGFEATKLIRTIENEENLEKTNIVALTANAMKGDEEVCLLAGMDDYIVKPFRPADLEGALLLWVPKNKRLIVYGN